MGNGKGKMGNGKMGVKVLDLRSKNVMMKLVCNIETSSIVISEGENKAI